MRFQVVFTYDAEYKGYVAEVPELPGCFSQGRSVEEAATNVKDAIGGYLEVLRKRGIPFVPAEHPAFVAEIGI